ncbi:MAG: hypothetical protein MR606_04085 [Mollicutes bacterium]|nr:hypothetical protein [Mollicutes bacterium]MDD7264104.1 hypothetical protein [bacterium]MDY4979139.1 hypothetical protein [Candidatus Onthovivens sp.]
MKINYYRIINSSIVLILVLIGIILSIYPTFLVEYKACTIDGQAVYFCVLITSQLFYFGGNGSFKPFLANESKAFIDNSEVQTLLSNNIDFKINGSVYFIVLFILSIIAIIFYIVFYKNKFVSFITSFVLIISTILFSYSCKIFENSNLTTLKNIDYKQVQNYLGTYLLLITFGISSILTLGHSFFLIIKKDS